VAGKNSNDSTYSDARNRIVLSTVRAARRQRSQPIWLYAGVAEETSDRDKDGIIDVVDDTQDLASELVLKGLVNPSEAKVIIDKKGTHSIESWSSHFPEFLIWAFGK
jgi:iron(III)-enterobactin esterase